MQKSTEPYRLKSPCAKCPFRTDIKPFLKSDRVLEIEDSLYNGEFPCHETLDYDQDSDADDGGEGRETEKTAHCAGALILLEKLDRPSQMMRISERLGMYDRRNLDMDAPVFDSFEEMAEAQEDRYARRRKRKTKAG